MSQITQQYMDNTIDSLITAHILLRYRVSNINEIDLNNVTNQLDRSLIEVMLRPHYNFDIQVICLETKSELVQPFECGICYEERQTIEKITLNCQHDMCKECAKKCVANKLCCPFCRGTITSIEMKDATFVHEF